MLKPAVISVMAVLSLGAADAQQAASLQKLDVPDADFDIVLATAVSPAMPLGQLGNSPDAFIIHLADGKLALGFEDAERMLKTFDTLSNPGCTLSLAARDSEARQTASIYIVRKGGAIATLGK